MSSWQRIFRHCSIVLAFTGLLLVSPLRALASKPPEAGGTVPGSHTDSPPASDDANASTPAKADQVRYLRVVDDKGKSIALQIATRIYTHPQEDRPRVALVGVAHIADRSFYRSIEKHLRDYDVVLYESVKPPGTGGAGGETDQQRIDSTREAIKFVASVVESHRARHDRYPADLEALKKFAAEKDGRLVQFLNIALVDAWGNSLVYEVDATANDAADAADAGDVAADKMAAEDEAAADDVAAARADQSAAAYTLKSLGADGKPGGEGANADIALPHAPDIQALQLSADDGLQSQLADALGLEFQLVSLPYDEPNWRCSDMAMDEVSRRLAAKGVDFDLMGGTLAGSSLPAKLIKMLLSMMKMFDAFTEGAITDTFKVIMIEVLGDPTVLDQSLSQFGEGFADVIVADRNQVVVDDLAKLMQTEPQVKSVAILYGAAHMPDLAQRLTEQLGYQPQPQEQDIWFPAITVDLTQSKVSPQDLMMIRRMMKQAIRQQFGRS